MSIVDDVEEPTELSFIFEWTVQVTQIANGFNMFGDTESFTTLYKCCSQEWVTHIYRTNVGIPRRYKVHLYLEQSRPAVERISPKQCNFAVRLLSEEDSNGDLIAKCAGVRSTTTFSSMDSFRPPRDSDFVERLTDIFTDERNVGKTARITIDLLFDAESFKSKFPVLMATIPPPPKDISKDFRFKMLREDAADFTLHCRDGDMKTSKSALFLSSEYFRSIFTNSEGGLTSVDHSLIEYSKNSVRQVVTFLTTGTFEMPEDLTPEMAEELLRIAVHFQPLNKDYFRNTIHKGLYDNLFKDLKSLDRIVRFLAFAQDMNLTFLKHVCISVIAHSYYLRFSREYSEDAADETRRALFEQLSRGAHLLGVSPIARINAVYLQSQKCRAIYRYGQKREVTEPEVTQPEDARAVSPGNIFMALFRALG